MRLLTSSLIPFGLLAISLSACGGETPETREEPSATVHLRMAEWTDVPESFEYAGTVRGTRQSQLSTKMMGRITYLRVEEGERVRRGQTLVRIKSDNVAAQKDQVVASLNEAESALANAVRDFERMTALFESESATQKELDDARTHHEMSKARVSSLKARLSEVEDVLEYSTIAAPMDGSVVRKHADEGDMASPGMPLLTVEDTGNLEVVARVPESDVGRLAVGDTVAVRVGALEGVKVPGIITRINSSGDAATRQFDVQVALGRTPQSVAIKSGMFARVVLEQGGRSVITVPADALLKRGQLTGLFTVDADDRALLRWVRTGKRHADHIEILSGLTEGEAYVASHEGPLADGQRVRIMN